MRIIGGPALKGVGMAEAKHQQKASPANAGDAQALEGGRLRLRSLWPIPMLVIAAALLGSGVWLTLSQRPKADASVPLREAEAMVERGDHPGAIDVLNGPALGFLDSGTATPNQQQRFFLCRARAFAGAQAALAISRRENHERIVADLKKVEDLGGDLEPADAAMLVESMIALGEVDESLRRIAGLGDGQRDRKLRLTRLLVEHNLSQRDPGQRRDELTLDLLARMSTDADLPMDDRAWVVAKQAELLLSLDRVEDAITKLLREIQRLRDLPQERQGELYVLLGRSYLEAGQPENASKQLDAADRLLDRGSLFRADAAVLSGRIAQAQGEAGRERARDRYAMVVAEFSSSRAYLPAVLGLAEIEGAMREFDRSIEYYLELAEAIRRSDPPPPPQADRSAVTASLLTRFDELTAAGDVATALRYGNIAESLYSGRDALHVLVSSLARAHRRLADEQLEAARIQNSADFTVKDLDPATRAEVKRHYLAAGEYFRRHAEQMAGENSAAYADSLWNAADSFDLAGDLEEARKAFSAYVDGAADNDPNRPAAAFRLAQIFQAEGDYAAAEAIYETLRESAGERQRPGSAGSWSDRAVVPLAMCYLQDTDAENDVRAEALLSQMVDGTVLSPDAKDYREALVALGNLLYAQGRYPEAIARLEEILNRYADDASPLGPRLEAVRFKLADSHRLEAARIGETLRSAHSQVVEAELRADRADHLRQAITIYEQTRKALEAAPQARLTDLDKTFLRNASFYIGDCAFELGEYSRAIAAYDAAALAYVDDPASLVAMVQIVNAYVAQSQWAQARTANERARRHLARFPDEVWDRRDLPMGKQHWERWLAARQVLEQSADAGGSGGTP